MRVEVESSSWGMVHWRAGQVLGQGSTQHELTTLTQRVMEHEEAAEGNFFYRKR